MTRTFYFRPVGDHLLDPECDGEPTTLCRKLSRGEAKKEQSSPYEIARGIVDRLAIAKKGVVKQA